MAVEAVVSGDVREDVFQDSVYGTASRTPEGPFLLALTEGGPHSTTKGGVPRALLTRDELNQLRAEIDKAIKALQEEIPF